MAQRAAVININSRDYSISSGDFIIINSNKIHKLIAKESPTIYYALIIDNNFTSLLDMDCTKVNFEPTTKDRGCINVLLEIFSEDSLKTDQYTSENINDLILVLMRRIFRQSELNPSDPKLAEDTSPVTIVKATLNFIKNHYQEELTIDKICKDISISKFYLCRIFKSVTGQTLNHYINQYRCQQAQILIKNTDLPLAEISFRCSYKDPTYFSKCYKKIFSIVPSYEKKISKQTH